MGYSLTSHSTPTMLMSSEGMMKSYEQARAILDNKPELRTDPEGGLVPIDETLHIEDNVAQAKRRLRLTRIAIWSNPIGWAVNAFNWAGVNWDTEIGSPMQPSILGKAKNDFRAEEQRPSIVALGTDVGIAVLRQIVRLNCARSNRARVDNANLAKEIQTGKTWVIDSEDLLNPDDLR